MRLPEELIPADDPEFLQCGCEKDEALLEMCCVVLGIVGEEKYAQTKERGYKAMSRPKRRHIWEILERTNEGPLECLLDLIEEESLVEIEG